MINNRQVNLWRGTDPPPTLYHIWIKDKKLWMYNGTEWIVFIDSISVIDQYAQLVNAVDKLNAVTINEIPLLDSPVLDASNLQVGKDLNLITATQSILDALEILDNKFHNGYEIKLSESQGTIDVQIGPESFQLTTSGNVSVRVGDGNKIIISSDAISDIDTEAPLQWKDKKLEHLKSGVTPAGYGESADQIRAVSFSIPYLVVDAYGHITEIKSTSVSIRDYVEQVAPSKDDIDRPLLESYNKTTETDNQPARKTNGLTFNDSSGDLKVPGKIVVSKGAEVTGGIIVTGGVIKGTLEGDATGTATPKIHLSNETTYGPASTTLYGHVILQDTLDSVEPKASNTNTDVSSGIIVTTEQAVAASPKMVFTALKVAKEYTDNEIGKIKIEISGYDSEEHTTSLNNGFTFSKDFVVKDKSVEISWNEI